MSVEQDLQKLILKKYKSVSQFAQAAGIPYTTVKGGLERGIMGMSVQNVIKMCHTLSIDVDKLAQGIIEQAKKNVALDVDEFNIINQYRVIDDSGKSLIRKVTAHEYERCMKSSANKLKEVERKPLDGNSSKLVTVAQAARTPDNRASIETTQMTEEELSIFDRAPQSDDEL